MTQQFYKGQLQNHHRCLSFHNLQVLCQVILRIQWCDVKGWNEETIEISLSNPVLKVTPVLNEGN